MTKAEMMRVNLAAADAFRELKKTTEASRVVAAFRALSRRAG